MANYELDEENGIIRDKLTGERCLVVGESGVKSIFKGLSRIFGSGIEVLLDESSREASRNAVPLADNDVDVKSLFNAYAKGFAQRGMGRLEVSELELKEGIVAVRVWNSLFAGIRDGENTYCSYVGGLLSGVYEKVLHASPRFKETKCIGHGDQYCEFRLALKTSSAF